MSWLQTWQGAAWWNPGVDVVIVLWFVFLFAALTVVWGRR